MAAATNGAPRSISYRSTRGGVSGLNFERAVFEGLAPDGGLLVPNEVPVVSEAVWKSWSKLSFADLAFEIAKLYCPEEVIPAVDLKELMARSYATFTHEQVVPTQQIGDMHIMELFHGPTFAFKDVALQALGNTYEYFLQRNGKKLTVLGATSGDTGSAAIYGMRGKRNVECFILFPEGKVSYIQQQQMTSVLDENVHCIAIDGNFDDCQDIVKELFRDLEFKQAVGLGAVNSINWARIMFQITYYFYTYYGLFPNCNGQISFSVPTGNFGDILAGYYAKRMGLPVKHLIVATNSNDILHRFLTTGKYEKYAVAQTTSPSMDIGISSNFERYLFYLFGEDSDTLASNMKAFNESGKLHVSESLRAKACEDFASGCASNDKVTQTIQEVKRKYGYLLDPHTACGVSAVEQLRARLNWASVPDHKMVVLGTAHPAKFGDAVKEATGEDVKLPPALEAIQGAATRKDDLPNDAMKVRAAIENLLESKTSRGGPCICF